jgi:RNA polymerase sigma factor (sigma-70 family)
MSASQPSTDEAAQEFLRYAATGDCAILDRLLADHLDRAYSQARRLLTSNQDAEDAVQNAFIKLMRTVHRYDGTIPFIAWLSRFVHAAAVDMLRTRQRRRRRESQAGLERGDEAAQQADPVEADLVRDAVRDLPERYRASIDLHYFAGLSQRDTAKALGTNENALAVRLHRARDCLRALLERRGISVGGGAIALALTSTPTYAAPPALAIKCSTLSAAPLAAATARLPLLVAQTGAAKLAAGVIAGAVALAAAGTIFFSERSAPAIPQTADVFTMQVNCENGEPDDVRVVAGSWEWRPAKAGRDAAMVPTDEVQSGVARVVLALQAEIPDRPVAGYFTAYSDRKSPRVMLGWLDRDGKIAAYEPKAATTHPSNQALTVLRVYVTREYIVLLSDSGQGAVYRYDPAQVDRHLFLRLTNQDFVSLELSEAAVADIGPQALALIKSVQ